MSEEKSKTEESTDDSKFKLQDTYDFSKSIENITLSSTYIPGLERLMIFFIERMNDPSLVVSYFNKFQDYIDGKLDPTTTFTEEEMHLYTIFSLQQLLKYHAYNQGLNIKVDATVDQQLITDVLSALDEGNLEKMREAGKKIEDQVNSQLS